MANGCVANFGNDANTGTVVDGNNITDAEWKNAKKTFQGAKDVGFNKIYAKGSFYNENISIESQIIGTPFVFINGYNGSINTTKVGGHNAKMINLAGIRRYSDIINSDVYNSGDIVAQRGIITKSVIYNCESFYPVDSHSFITFFKTNILYRTGKFLNDSIFVDSPIDHFIFNRSLFINDTFKFKGGNQGADETTYTYPTGSTDDEKLQNLRDRMVTVYGGIASDYLIGCKYYSGSYNDIFIDADNGDFNLVPFCIAAHMSYNGNYVGARPEGIKADWDIDFSNIVNIDTIGNVIDQTIDSTALSSILDIGYIREILKFDSLGSRAARNGQQMNIETNLGTNISSGTNVLTNGSVYVCIDNTITIDDSVSTILSPWDTFTALDEGTGIGLGFTGIGAVKEVYTDNRYDEKIQFKASKTDPTLSTVTLITSKLHSDPILVNIDGNDEPTFGDADIGFDILTAVPLNIRFIQFTINIKANNLPAR